MNQIEALYRQYASAVFRFAWGLCGDRSLAEDIVSETYVRLLTRAPEVGTQTALAYLLAIARNTYVSGVRRRWRDVPLPHALPGPDVDHAARLDGRARLQALFDAVRSLPEGERAALLLRVDHELSYEDIASALGTSVGAAKVRVHRAPCPDHGSRQRRRKVVMKLEVTRDVVSDLWPLYRAGDASPDSRGLVEAFLAGDAAFASTLKESEMLSHVVPPVRLSPEGELRLLQDAQQRARTKLLVVAGSIAAGAILLFAAFAAVLWVFMSGRMS